MGVTDGDATIQCGQMTVTVDRFQPMLETGSCVGFAKVAFRTAVGSISIDNFRLIKGKKGSMFVAAPSHKKGEKFYDDVVVDGDLRKMLNGLVKKAYQDSKG